MSDIFESGAIDKAIGVALNGLATRQRVTANNLANVDTPGFKASAVTFEEKLHQALGKARRDPARLASTQSELSLNAASALERVEPEVVRRDGTTMRMDGNNVDVEEEMIQLADTAISYNVLVQLASARLSLARYVLNDGRR